MKSGLHVSDTDETTELPYKRLRVELPRSSKPPPQVVVQPAYPQFDHPEHNHVVSDETILTDCPIFDTAKTTSLSAATSAPVIITDTSCVRHKVTGGVLGQLDGHTAEILSRLSADAEFTCQLTARRDAIVPTRARPRNRGLIGYLSIIIYGPNHSFEDIGRFMTACGRFLEDPIGCNHDVPYMNPQCLFSLYETPITTFSLSKHFHHPIGDFTQACSDILARFETSGPLYETPTPEPLRTALKPHQRQALSFLLRREQGMHPSEDTIGLWAPQANGTGYTNTITNETQIDPGPLWRGGMLADEMGLGKTLSMIALIASDHAQINGHWISVDGDDGKELCSTLVILPLSLIPVWISQLESHVQSGRLTHVVHHRNNRLRLAANVKPPDIVFTTYQTIEHEQRKLEPVKGALSNYSWRRVILDEAHIIRTHGNATARAVTALKSRTRWALSGTPIQNKLTDFLGYLKFLHFVPYDDPEVFDAELSQLWRDKPEDEAVEIFKKFLTCVMLRRSKGVLDLPARRDKVVYVAFEAEEERRYRHAEQPTPDLLDQRPWESWPTAIQQINKLRIICNLGLYVPQQMEANEPVALGGSFQAKLASRLYMGEDVCAQCLGPVSLPSIDAEMGRAKSSNTYYSVCGQLYCAACAILLNSECPTPCGCVGSSKPCPLLPLSSSIRTPRLTPVRDCSPAFGQASDTRISSKIRTLVEQITSCLDEKHVVFSFWTSSLDMVERGLATTGVGFVRIDGSVAPSDRAQAIQKLRSDPMTRVILLTIGCGACGLDLTAASRVHLLEPQWNPAVEDQAFARSHRLGQKRTVTTLRYIMKGSIEQDIIQVLDEKRLLATSLLSDSAATKALQVLLRNRQNQTP